MDTLTCLLPGGYLDAAGALHQEAELAPLSGREEELLAGRSGRSNAALVTHILSRCVLRVGTIRPISQAIARDLLVADRQYLMLMLRRATFGDEVQATLVCPWADCAQKVDIDFRLSAIPVRRAAGRSAAHALRLSPAAAVIDAHGAPQRDLVFRLPSGGDQELIAPLALHDEQQALAALLGRCICAIGDPLRPAEALAGRLSPLARAEIDQAMEAVAPAVELSIGGLCPECGREFSQPFDLQDFVFGELRIGRASLYREVHYLAYHYHWSECEIMALPRLKRRMYIEILAEEIERMHDALA